MKIRQSRAKPSYTVARSPATLDSSVRECGANRRPLRWLPPLFVARMPLPLPSPSPTMRTRTPGVAKQHKALARKVASHQVPALDSHRAVHRGSPPRRNVARAGRGPNNQNRHFTWSRTAAHIPPVNLADKSRHALLTASSTSRRGCTNLLLNSEPTPYLATATGSKNETSDDGSSPRTPHRWPWLLGAALESCINIDVQILSATRGAATCPSTTALRGGSELARLFHASGKTSRANPKRTRPGLWPPPISK